jgi:hypothetical protein
MMQGQLMAAWSPFGAKLAERNMNWLTNVVRPKIRSMLRRKVRKNLWIKCPDTEQLVLRDHGMVDMVVASPRHAPDAGEAVPLADEIAAGASRRETRANHQDSGAG